MNRIERKIYARRRRAHRIRKKVFGTAARPRLCVNRSLRHIRAQIIDDTAGRCLVEVTSASKAFSEKLSSAGKKPTKTDISKMVGEIIAERAKSQGITTVVFDRKGYLFHGRVRALAEGARSKGLRF